MIIGDVTVGDDASIWWGAVLRSDLSGIPIVIGARTSIQDNCVLHSGEAPTLIEDDCTIGHGAIMEGCADQTRRHHRHERALFWKTSRSAKTR